jgi:purine-binding chemotaxis protein CheW
MQPTLTAPAPNNSGMLANAPALKSDERAGKYLTFMIGKEEFGVGVLKVREIMGIQDITAVPQTPPYLKGVINLRGKVTPVIDLRLKFGLPSIEYTQRTCIIVVQVKSATATLLMGIVVDEVSEVLTMAAADIEDTPDFGASVSTTYILGMAKIKGKVKILLDINEVLTSQEIHGLEAVIQ